MIGGVTASFNGAVANSRTSVTLRFVAHQDNHTQSHIATPHWDDGDALHPLLALLAGRYPSPDSEIADYRGGVQSAFNVKEIAIAPAGEIPASLLENITPVCTENHIRVYQITESAKFAQW